jgi:hypothetical protein
MRSRGARAARRDRPGDGATVLFTGIMAALAMALSSVPVIGNTPRLRAVRL